MAEPVDLELSLRRRGGRYAIDMRLSQPGSDAEVRPLRDHSPLARFDLARLSALALDPDGYGRALGQMLLADPPVATAMAQARAVAQSQGLPLRLRLAIAPDAAELQALRWETLRDPADDARLAVGEQCYFVRHLISADWQPARLRARGDLRALLAIANPRGLEQYGLQPLDLAAEQELALAGLAGLPTTLLAGEVRPTLEAIATRLREGYDILYLVCHGAVVDGEPWLFLEDAGGALARVPGAELALRLGELAQRPRLAMLVSCQSAGDGTPEALSALAPRVAEAGLPAVLAMQGLLSVETGRAFMGAFCAELARDGRIDRAAAVARGAVRDRDDAWAPALFCRLGSGRIWYTPGFGDERASFERWPALLRSINEGRCTPIIGLGVLEPLIGSTREIAGRWADAYGFPLAPAGREDLPQVAQFLAVHQDEYFVRGELRETIRQELLRRFGQQPALDDAQAPLDQLLLAAAALQAARGQAIPHRVLAGLPFPAYLTTCPDSLLDQALREAGRAPDVAVCPWNDEGEAAPAYTGTPERDRPLIYHLFGRLADPASLVLTEDDYFNYLIGFTRNRDLVPRVVRWRLTDTALLFIGFRLEEWPFRVLFRSVMNEAVRNRRLRNTHVAVQIELDERSAAQPERARRFLEGWFDDADVSIYWGSAEDFLRELDERQRAGARQSAVGGRQ